MKFNGLLSPTYHQRWWMIGAILLVFGPLMVGHSFSEAEIPQALVNGGQSLYKVTGAEQVARRVAAPFSGQQIYELKYDSKPVQRYYAATEVGLFISDNAGHSWSKQDLPVAGAARLRQDVFAVAALNGMLWIGTHDGLFMTTQADAGWRKVTDGLPDGLIPLAIEVAAADARVMYLGSARHGVFRSDDGGYSWRAVNRGLPAAVGAAPMSPIDHLVIDPSESDIVYVSTDVNGFYVTHDGGSQWTAINEGLPVPLPYRTHTPRLAVHPRQPRVLYALIAYPVHSHRIEHRLYRSSSRGAQWDYVGTLPDQLSGHTLEFHPDRPDLLIVGHEQGVLMFSDEAVVMDHPTAQDTPLPEAPARASSQAQPPADFDVGNVAVLHDDGTLFHLFDLNGRSIQFERLEPDNYGASFVPFSFDSTPGTPLSLGDNDFVSVNIPFTFLFYNREHTSVFVNSNGNLTFGQGSRDRIPSIGFPPARIAPFWTDLDPSRGGQITVRAAADRLVVTWSNVPEVGTGALNTFQVVLFSNNRILFTFSDVRSRTGLTGISQGLALLGSVVDFTEDLPLPRVAFRTAIYESFDGRFQIAAIARRFYRTHQDDYEFLTAIGTSDTPYDVVGGGGFAFYAPIQNNVRGIGRSVGEFNGGPRAFGSAGRLEGFINFNKLSEYPDNPNQTFLGTNSTLDIMAQEFGHRWLAFVEFSDAGVPSSALLGRDFAHWSFFKDSDASEMEGNKWLDQGGGLFLSIEATSRYSMLDRYLMGLASAAEVAPFFFIRAPTDTNRVSSSPPEVGVRVRGTRQNVTVAQIIAEEGVRIPAFPTAPTRFRQAFILVVPEGRRASQDDLNKVEIIRQSWELFFNVITGGRGTVNARLSTATGADLVPAQVSVSPASVAPGSSVNLSFLVINQGQAPAAAAVHEIRLSEDAIVNANDLLLSTVATSTLAPGSSVSFSISIVIPPGIPPGQRFIGIIADSSNAVSETDETNNIAVAPLTVLGAAQADLLPTNLSVSPSTVPAGGSITVNVTIANQGVGVAASTIHQIRLSADGFIDANDTLLTTLVTPELQPGAALPFVVTTTIPAGTPAGGRFVGVLVDATNQVSETNEANNTLSVFINVTNPKR
ncbi:MAG: CARDB domain-containing protein [Acidobacteriota bacterium]|nr:hypothetical protein [Blastocatellia bacterium]MDW8241266.1 CARDB domain-containing protein [Acidobacteriota bacterium]